MQVNSHPPRGREQWEGLKGSDHRIYRVATASFWRTFSDESKSVLAGEGGGARPPPLITFTLTSKVAVYAPPE